MSDVPIVLFSCENGWHMTSDRYMTCDRYMTGGRHMTGDCFMTRDSLIASIVLRLL